MKIQEYLKKQKVPFELREHPPAYTAQEVAAEEHVSGDMLAKAVIVKADKDFVMCVLSASYKLDTDKAAEVLRVKKVRLADEAELAKLFPDAEVGAEPPFGSLYNMTTIMDRHLSEEDEIVFQSGTHRQSICMKCKDYRDLVAPTIADLAVHL